MEAERVRQNIVGMTVGVALQGKTQWIAPFGKADLENLAPVKKETLFRTASIAKPITAVAALQLYERGKLDIDAPLQKVLPLFPDKGQKVTVRQLLGHLGGIRHYRGQEMDSTIHFENVLEPLRVFIADPLVHEPGSKYLYTTYGYNLVGAAVEAAAGQPFLDFVEENIFRPAKMETARDDNSRAIIPNRTRFYSRDKEGRIINAVLSDTSNKIPGGGLVASTQDLLQFLQAWDSGQLLKPVTMKMQTTPQKLKDGKRTGYGLGWNVSPLAGKKAISHGGSQHGTKTLMALFPDYRLSLVVLTNSDFAEPNQVAEAFWRAVEAQLSTVTAKSGQAGKLAQ